MVRSLILLTIFTLGVSAQAQTLQVSTVEAEVTLLQGDINSEGIILSDENSEVLNAAYNYPNTPDPSLKVYTMINGDFVVRENIANFLIYDSFGNTKQSISNSSQSEGGEAISELAMDHFGKTVVLYNPQIVSGSNTGSSAQKVDKNGDRLNLFYSSDRALRYVSVSPNGEFIAMVTEKSGTEDTAVLLDRFGNQLGTMSFDQEISGVSFSENGLFVTIFSVGRAAVYQIRDGERVGSTSFRSTSLKFANYDPIDKTIIAVTGAGGATFSEVEFHAINVEARKIARQEISETLQLIGNPVLTRTSSGRYSITGFDRNLDLKASF